MRRFWAQMEYRWPRAVDTFVIGSHKRTQSNRFHQTSAKYMIQEFGVKKKATEKREAANCVNWELPTAFQWVLLLKRC